MGVDDIPELDLKCRQKTAQGADFLTYLFSPIAASGRTDDPLKRSELWLKLTRNKVQQRLGRENYYRQTHSNGAQETVWYWEDNSRLARIGNAIYELVESKAVKPWR